MKVKLHDGLVLRVEFKEIRPKKGTSLLHKATHLTIAEVSRPGWGTVVGRAFTSRKDKHDPYEGRKTALQRALALSPAHENERLRIWVAFFAHEYELVRQRPRKFTGGLGWLRPTKNGLLIYDETSLKGISAPVSAPRPARSGRA